MHRAASRHGTGCASDEPHSNLPMPQYAQPAWTSFAGEAHTCLAVAAASLPTCWALAARPGATSSGPVTSLFLAVRVEVAEGLLVVTCKQGAFENPCPLLAHVSWLHISLNKAAGATCQAHSPHRWPRSC